MITRVFVSLICTSAAVPLSVCSAASTDWLQFGFDPTHSGINPGESLLTPANVNYLALKYSKTFSAPAQGTPVFLSNVSTSQGVIDMLFVTLNDGSLLALNAANGAQVWANLPTSVPACGQAGQNPQCLVTSSPAIDPNRNYVYNFSRVDGSIHKFAVATGAETIEPDHWPAVSSTKPDVEKGSSAITFATSSTDPNHDTYLYMTHSSFLASDGGDYQGHITAINLRTGTQIVFNAVCSDQGNVHFVENGKVTSPGQTDCYQAQTTNSSEVSVPAGNAGIWGRAAATYDPVNDSIYISTANGVYDPTNTMNYGGSFWGDSVLRLPAAMSTELFEPLDSYTPPNFLDLMRDDIDLGSASLAIIPASMTAGFAYPHIGIQAGKDSDIRIIDLDDMSVHGPQWSNTTPESAVFTAGVPQTNEVKTQPLIWQNPTDNTVLVIVSNDFGISAMQLITDGSGNPQLVSRWVNTGAGLKPHGNAYGGGSPAIADNVLYYASASGLLALDLATGNVLVAKTEMGISTTSPGVFHKQSPIIVNGRVYVTDENANLWVYEGDEIFPDGFD